MGYNWTCPYCNRDTTLVYKTYEKEERSIRNDSSEYGSIGIDYMAISCPNPECKKLSFSVGLHNYKEKHDVIVRGDQLHWWNLLPESNSKPQPDYIPKPIVADYYDACRIVDLVPKASATLARRCLQGIIRDFWSVKDKPNLKQEIDAIEDKVDPTTWKAIDTVRTVGNIGAHMERDIDLIIDVEPNEAKLLISLIETLLRDWYVERHEREQRMSQIAALAEKKEQQRKAPAAGVADEE